MTILARDQSSKERRRMVAFEQEEKGGLSKEAWKHESLMDTEILVVGKRLVLFLRECSPQGCFLQKLKSRVFCISFLNLEFKSRPTLRARSMW